MSALHHAVLNEDADAFNFLLENGANPEAEDAEGNTPLSQAILKGQTDFVRKMLDLGANPDSLLLSAASLGNIEIARLILEKGGNPNIEKQNSGGLRPLVSAVISDNYKMAELLLKNGADPSIQYDGSKLLGYCTRPGSKRERLLNRFNIHPVMERLLNRFNIRLDLKRLLKRYMPSPENA
jgi:ankyrin repeat protein